MTLVLEIEYLSGVSFAAIGPDSPERDWPPQPDRIFSALVATWAARGQSEVEAEALEWLEEQWPAELIFKDGLPRTTATVFVPPNDPRSDKKKHAKGVLPAFRSRQPRRFPAMRPHHSTVRLIWPDIKPEDTILDSLDRLARDTSYIGHSTSLTRCRFLLDPDEQCLNEAKPPERRIYPGRFAELRRSFDARRRPSPGAPVAPISETESERQNAFGDRWLILDHVNGEMPDLRACALVARSIRNALMGGYRKAGHDDPISAVVSGHDPDGKPTQQPHLAVLPLAFLGYPHADGHVMGYALVPPSGNKLFDSREFQSALRKAAPIDENLGRRILTIQSEAGTSRENAFSLKLSPTFEVPAGKRSLDPNLYTRRSKIFATATPILLDRHLKKKGAEREKEIGEQIAAACRNIGLPEPIRILPDKHSAIEGAPSAYPSGKSPTWMRWRLPPSLASRQLTHAVIEFAECVDGPVILGAGRFVGLGLCRPIGKRKQ